MVAAVRYAFAHKKRRSPTISEGSDCLRKKNLRRRPGKERKPKKQTGAGKKRKPRTGKKSKSRKQTGDGLWSGLKEIFQ